MNDLQVGARNDFILLGGAIVVSFILYNLTQNLQGACSFLLGCYMGFGLRLYAYNRENLKAWIIPLWALAVFSLPIRIFCHKENEGL